jgi:hypothetical protein
VTQVLLLATTTGYQIRSFGEAAAAMGVRLVFASDRCDQLEDPWWDGAIPVRFHDEARSLAAIGRWWGDARPDGIIAVGDGTVRLAASAAAALGCRGNTPDAAAASRNKEASRLAFAAAHVSRCAFAVMGLGADSEQAIAGLPYPLVVKPLALSGSCGVMRVDDAEQLAAAVARLKRLLTTPDLLAEHDPAHAQLLVETFVAGREYAIEGVLTEGTFRAFAIFDKPDPLDGPLFEETIYVTPSRAPRREQQAMLDAVAAATRALGLTHGPVHAECRVHDGRVHVLEVAARPIGGLCSRALRFHGAGRHDVSLEEVLLRHAVGEDITAFEREPPASGVMMLPIPRRGVFRGAARIDEARAVPGIDDVRITAKPGAVLVPLPEGRSYLGFLFARGDSAAGVEEALREAHRRLRFTIERAVDVREA